MSVCILIPTRNELQGLKEIVPQIQPEWYDRLVIVDGDSTDGTVEYARAKNYEVFEQEGRGIRDGYLGVYGQIKEDIIITFSPDGNSIPEAIPCLVEKIEEGFDMVIASRYKNDARSYDDTWLTGLGNYVFTKLISLFGYKYTDAMVMYRAYRKEVPARLKLNVKRSHFFEKYIGSYVSWESLMSIRAAKAKLRIAEIPFDEPKRISEEPQRGLFLSISRIYHFRTGLACFLQLLEELVFWKF